MEKKIIVLAHASEIPASMTNPKKYSLIYTLNKQTAITLAAQEKLAAIFVTEGNSWLSDIKELSRNFYTSHLPIIFFYKQFHTVEKAVELGVDDFIHTECNEEMLALRTSMNIARAKREVSKNPLTKLPGNDEIKNVFSSKKSGSCIHVDIDNFKKYNDENGFLEGDRVIKSTAQLLMRELARIGSSTNFLGHIGGDDFFIYTECENPEKLCENIEKEFCEMEPKLTISIGRL